MIIIHDSSEVILRFFLKFEETRSRLLGTVGADFDEELLTTQSTA
jgi:hypothetical protein